MIWNPAKFVALLLCVIFWIFVAFLVIGCASVNNVNSDKTWPVGMNEDAQGFYNSKYNFLDNGKSDPNTYIKLYKIEY